MVAELAKHDVYYVGAVRSDRQHRAGLLADTALVHKRRGSFDQVVETTGNMSLVKWSDNKCVTIISSFVGAEPVSDVRRYDKKKEGAHPSSTSCHRRCVQP